MSDTSIYFKPTVLMVKQHNKTGKKYFHKTTRLELIETYSGSGVYWKRHLKKHGNDWTNIWVSDVFYDKDDLVEFALFFSEFYEIVRSKDWANEKPENGLDGGHIGSDEKYKKASIKQSQTRQKEEWKKTAGKDQRVKISNTMNDLVWKETVGVQKRNKNNEIRNSDEWKNTVGKYAKQKELETKNSQTWKETVGAQCYNKQKDTNKRLQDRDIVKEIRDLANTEKIKLGSGWVRKKDADLSIILERLKNASTSVQ